MEENALRLTGLGTMLETLRANRRHADRDLLLFDYQPAFLARDGDLPEEPNFLTAVIGERVNAGRWDETGSVELPFVRGVVDELLSRSGVPSDEASHDGLKHPTFTAGAAAAVTHRGRLLAAYGEVDTEIAAAFDLDEARLGAAGGHACRSGGFSRRAIVQRLVGVPVGPTRPGDRR